MRFHLGLPPKDDAILKEDDAWCPIDESGHMRFQIRGILVAFFVTTAIALVLLGRDPKYVTNVSWPIVMLFILLAMPIHEFLHAISFKGGVLSKGVIFGFYPKAVAFYAHYSGVITWNRYIFISLFPFLILTVIPLAIMIVFNLKLNYIVEIIFANGLASAGDVLTTLTIIKQVPKRSILVNSGIKTYWKPVANTDGQENGGQLIDSETNRTSGAAGSRR